MRLHTYAVYWRSAVAKHLYEIEASLSLIGVGETVVVVVKFDRKIIRLSYLVGFFERVRYVFVTAANLVPIDPIVTARGHIVVRAPDVAVLAFRLVVELRRRHGIVKRFVHNVPNINVVSEMFHNIFDILVDIPERTRLYALAVSLTVKLIVQPRRKRLVPKKTVSANADIVCLRPFYERVRAVSRLVESICPFRPFEIFPLHTVFGRYAVEMFHEIAVTAV